MRPCVTETNAISANIKLEDGIKPYLSKFEHPQLWTIVAYSKVQYYLTIGYDATSVFYLIYYQSNT